jgi:hypothetical protein
MKNLSKLNEEKKKDFWIRDYRQHSYIAVEKTIKGD